MPLVTSVEMLEQAQRGGYAVGAFNVENMEMAQAVVAAAVELDAPVLLQTTPGTLGYAPPSVYRAMVAALAAGVDVPVAVHLDHGNSVALCHQVMVDGYTSVMIDGSTLPFAENCALTAAVVELAAERGIPVEAELGAVGGKEDNHTVNDRDALYTNPEQAAEFVERTGLTSLAVAIGTAHGFYSGEPRLDFDRLQAIAANVTVPLVLHGASGLKDAAVRQAIALGICKVNFATELRAAYTLAARSALADTGVIDPKVYGRAGLGAVKALVMERMQVCGCPGKARSSSR